VFADHNFEFAACNTLMVSLNVTIPVSNPSGGGNVWVYITNGLESNPLSPVNPLTPTVISGNGCPGGSCTITIPLPNAANGYPLPGTRGQIGLAAKLVVKTGYFTYDTGPATVTPTLTRASRPGYNVGGDAFTNAPLIGFFETQYGSVFDPEPGQFYKIRIKQNQVIYLTGQCTGSTTWGTNFYVNLYNAALTDVKLLVQCSAGGTVTFPAANANPASYIYKNSGADADFYLKAHSGAWMTWDFRFTVKTMVSGPTTVWWFSGQNPEQYDTAITLTSAAGASTTWSIISGSTKVNLSTTSGAETIVTSTGSAFSSAVNDIVIRAAGWGVTTDFLVTSRTPYRLLPATQQTFCDSTYGYVSYVPYVVMDQLDDPIPESVGANEEWTTAVYKDYPDPPGTNWVRGEPVGRDTAGSSLVDQISGEPLINSPVPTPTCDDNSQPVDHWGQAWRVGSTTIGAGKLVQTDTLQSMVGKATHTNPVSPPQ
jgi:hypothetical protein